MRRTEKMVDNWRFSYECDIAADDRVYGNVQIIANETSLWQKAGNHGLSRPVGVSQTVSSPYPGDEVSGLARVAGYAVRRPWAGRIGCGGQASVRNLQEARL